MSENQTKKEGQIIVGADWGNEKGDISFVTVAKFTGGQCRILRVEKGK